MKRTRETPGLLAACALAGLVLAGCGPSARTVALEQVHATTPRERSAAVRALAKLGKPDDDELWVAIERLTRDPSVHVRIAAAESLAAAPKSDEREPDERGALADDALSAELSDLDETVRIAAARVLGARCNPRAIAYLHGAFSHSGPAVRVVVADSLQRCGVPLDKLLAHAEEVARMHALEKLTSSSSAWRVAAVRSLGLLGRPDDVAKILPLVDDRDGNVAAAAAEGLGFSAARSAIPALQKLAGDEVPLIASAAIEALGSFGPEALSGAQPALARQAAAGGDQAVPAAGALAEVAPRELACQTAAKAVVPAAAALLAHGCPAAPFGEALAALLQGAKEPLAPAVAERAAALLEALGQSAQVVAIHNIGIPNINIGTSNIGIPAFPEKPSLALGRLAQLGDAGLATRAAEVAQLVGAVRAGPALLAVAQREKSALEAERAARKPQDDDRAAAARQLAEAAMRAPAGDRQKIARLMAMVRAREEKNGGAARPDAAARLRKLLEGEPAAASSHPLLAAALRAALALGAKGAPELAASLRDDPEPALASAARGEPIPVEPPAPALSGECIPPPPDASVSRALDAGPFAPAAHGGDEADAGSGERDERLPTYVIPAPSRAAKPGCLAAWLALLPSAPPGAVESARASLWSDDGAERALACQFLARAGDRETASLRASFLHDPERRVRDACTAPGETASPAPR